MHEKFIVTSVMTAGLADVATSVIGFAKGLEEGGLLASHLIEQGDVNEAILARMGVATVLMVIYLLNKERPNKYSRSIDRGIRVGNIYAWSVAALNAVYITMV